MTESPVSVLVVDDNPLNLELATHVLQQAGHPVRQASSGPEALQSVRNELPGLILMDIGLPGMDGYAVLGELKKDPRTALIPVVALTAYAMPEDQQRALSSGFDGFITKPFEVRSLVPALARVLEQRANRG